jgi:hypothetical protein
MKQTAVEWLIQNLEQQSGSYRGFCNIRTTHEKMIEQAKEMEKEQIMHAYGQGAADEAGEILDATKDSEEYYDKKYGGEK